MPEYRIDIIRTRRYLVTARSREEAKSIVSMYDANNDAAEDEIEDRFVRSAKDDDRRTPIEWRDAFPWELAEIDEDEV